MSTSTHVYSIINRVLKIFFKVMEVVVPISIVGIGLYEDLEEKT